MKPKTAPKDALQQMISEKGKKRGLTVEGLDGCLKSGTLKEKRHKVKSFVDSVMNDESKWEEMQGDIVSIKQKRMKVVTVKPSSERVEQTRGMLE